MRKVLEPQMELGELPIGLIELDPRSRDDIPQILRGLQHLYTTPEVRAEVFAILAELVPERSTETGPEKVDVENGRPGMSQWNLLVLGVLRLGLNADYDRIRELANEHRTIRQFLGHSGWDDDTSHIDWTLTPMDCGAPLCHPLQQEHRAHPGDPPCPTPARPWSASMPLPGTT